MSVRHRCQITYVQPVNWPLRVYHGEEGFQYFRADYLRYTGTEFHEELPGDAFFTGLGGILMMYFSELDEDGHPDLTSLVHECLHCSTYVWERAGANLHVFENDEVLAYQQGHILELVAETFARLA